MCVMYVCVLYMCVWITYTEDMVHISLVIGTDGGLADHATYMADIVYV